MAKYKYIQHQVLIGNEWVKEFTILDDQNMIICGWSDNTGFFSTINHDKLISAPEIKNVVLSMLKANSEYENLVLEFQKENPYSNQRPSASQVRVGDFGAIWV